MMLESVYNHVVLPPRLPGREDRDLEGIERDLMTRLTNACRFIRDLNHERYTQWDSIRRSLEAARCVNAHRKINKAPLASELQRLQHDEALILHVVQQNAGVLITKHHNPIHTNDFVVEIFEAAAPSKNVLASQRALQWDFPGSSVLLTDSEFSTNFQESLSTFLERASTESIKQFAAQAHKAGVSSFECRDTVDPALISQMLMSLLEVNGHAIALPQLHKRIRDDVCWTDGAVEPWRRCPLWLVLRVGIQRQLRNLLGGEEGFVCYKLLMCVLHSQLLDDTVKHTLHPELVYLLKTKLCRRLAKLEDGSQTKSGTERNIYSHLFHDSGFFRRMIQSAHNYVTVQWEAFKSKQLRLIPRLPQRAQPQDSHLTLPNSQAYLRKVLSEHPDQLNTPSSPTTVDISTAASAAYLQFTNLYDRLSSFESEAEALKCEPVTDQGQPKVFEKAVTIIKHYLHEVIHTCAYESNAEQNGIMILTVMELWMIIDKYATLCYPMLMDFKPAFPPEIMDCLQLPLLKDMSRLQAIQDHLRRRHAACGETSFTIFCDPVKGCFAERYFEQSLESEGFHQIQQQIEDTAEATRAEKVAEWHELSSEYQSLIQEAEDSSCLSFVEDNSLGLPVHNERGCHKCYLERKAKRMSIAPYEHPLPENESQRKTIIFELACPRIFAIYRDTTWQILAMLGHEHPRESVHPYVTLADYPPLQQYHSSTERRISLASTTKSFAMTHYSKIRFPVDLSQVFKPNGLKVAYFDKLAILWPGRQPSRPTFQHHCRLKLPRKSSFTFYNTTNVTMATNEPSSYETIASQTKCPSGSNVHEYMAFQGVLSGTNRRWPSMLAELGSSNLNFSNESVTTLFSYLSNQAGPQWFSAATENDIPSDVNTSDVLPRYLQNGQDRCLRAVHVFFQNSSFCERYLQLLDERIDGIASNWRETNCMDMLITLSLRMCSLISFTTESFYTKARTLLERMRCITFRWISELRFEVQNAREAEAFRRYSMYLLLASLLCKRTLSVFFERQKSLPTMELQCFIECSIILQNNLGGDPSALPQAVKYAFVRDLKATHQMRYLIRNAVESDPQALRDAIESVWPKPEGSLHRTYSSPRILRSPHDWWVELTVEPSRYASQQTLHYHMLQGHLLVNGQPPGKLPAEHMQSLQVNRLFGAQSFQTYPSSMPGMAYMLTVKIQDHQVHIGYRDGATIIRACIKDSVLELIPQDVFGTSQNSDIPGCLIAGHDHWLNIDSGIMDIRPQADTWREKRSNWRLDFLKRRANRRLCSLIDPHCSLFKHVERIFSHFEYATNLELFQPPRNNLSLNLRRLELSFNVNRQGLLTCRELRQEIDPHQDAGTWYGLYSKIILRDTTNTRNRSILIPFGNLTKKRSDIHVAVNIANEGGYGRYTINDVLGRIECVAEPKLLYLKALLHAYTSFVVPDILTDRTGTEEALQFLQSGCCQPWAPISHASHNVLAEIARLTPHREYYPQVLEQMQKVSWDPDLTTTVQHDAFWSVVDVIAKKSEQLALFALARTELPPLIEKAPESHLHGRSLSRRSVYERQVLKLQHHRPFDNIYDSRGRRDRPEYRRKVMELKCIVDIIRRRPTKLPSTLDLAGRFQNWPNIGGFDRTFNKVLLSDCLSVNLALEWGGLVRLFRQSSHGTTDSLMFLSSVLSFSDSADLDFLRTLAAFAILDELKDIPLLPWSSFVHFRHNQLPGLDYLLQLIRPYGFPYTGDVRHDIPNLGGKQRRKLEAIEQAWKQSVEDDCKVFAQFLLDQWPCPQPSITDFARVVKIDVEKALQAINPEWLRMYKNIELSKWVNQVQDALNRHRGDSPSFPAAPVSADSEPLWQRLPGFSIPTLAECLASPRGAVLPSRDLQSQYAPPRGPRNQKENKSPKTARTSKAAITKNIAGVPAEIQELENIVKHFKASPSNVRRLYGEDLLRSTRALKELEKSSKPDLQPLENARSLREQISDADKKVRECHSRICQAIDESHSQTLWLKEGGLWPCTNATAILEQLRSTSPVTFGNGVKACVIDYALSITSLQRLLRMQDAFGKNKPDRVIEEQKNVGHSNWKPENYTDWLLLEVDANILIRPDQVDVALATATPASGQNSVLQMNMGQGKTSVIMPMVAALLANSKNLVRVCVPRALLLQTAQLLHSRLGALIGRELRHIPFSRKTPTTQSVIKTFWELHKELLRSSGIMVALPEHIMSFMLSGRQRLSDSQIPEATTMINVQNWARKHCRDILDECDFTLAVKTQLIYPTGSQRSVDGFPHRWQTAQTLLRLVQSHLWNLKKQFPYSIEVVWRESGGFPVVFFLRRDSEDALMKQLVDDVCDGRTGILPLAGCDQSDRWKIRTFISAARVPQEVADRVKHFWPDTPAAKKTLYLIRGLFVHRLLLLTLKKRWNVQYGLHPGRDPVAVPFHAKGVPSDQAEWGHPDVAILFTCLSFYYGGLSLNQLRQSLEMIMKSDDPAGEYDRLTHDSKSLPDSLREWNAINIDDQTQLMDIWYYVRNNMTVIDHFLNNFVFPKHAKQFPVKLQASGWDIPIAVPSASAGAASRTTGFSGTNDNKTMLPLTIKQNDLPSLSHINAEVLTYLLQPRCQSYQLAEDELGRFSEFRLLRKLHNMKIRILIDAGAQVLEMDNKSFAKQWLIEYNESLAALYFDSENKAMIIYRNGREVPFLATPFVDNLSDVLVYLDEAHTRGTDLKFPPDAKAALTLGLGITKDSLVQAAMRLRQLGTSQSVVFFASREVHQSIKDHRSKRYSVRVDSSDVIYWLLAQTCDNIEQLQPLFFSQGADYCRRTQAELDNPNFLNDEFHRDAYVKSIQQSEQRMLTQLYEPKPPSASGVFPENPSPEIAALVQELKARRKGFQDTGNAVHGSALQEVEQEREAQVQQETVREVQKPVLFLPLKFSGLNSDIVIFARTGRLVAGSQACEHVFSALSKTGVGVKYRINPSAMTSRFYASREFLKTVDLGYGRHNDTFLRPVNWLMWNTVTETALIVNPEEAELLIPILREAQSSQTHLLTYAAPVTRRMLHFNRLRFFAIPDLPVEWEAPEWLRIELGIFSGRLYFEESEYDPLCRYLGMKASHDKKDLVDDLPPGSIESNDEDGNIAEEQQVAIPKQDSFTAKPLVFLQHWLSVRRKGQEFANTPMGYVCQGRILTRDHPFFERARERPDSGHSSGQSEALRGSKQYRADEAIPSADDDDFDEDFDENEVGGMDDGNTEEYEAMDEEVEVYGGDYSFESH